MDTFFWVTIVTDLIHAVFIIGLGGIAVWLLLKAYRNNAPVLKETAPPASSESMKIILPLKLQACERLVLFLERIHPESLVIRILPEGRSMRSYQGQLLRTIREEFEYNLSQQLYISAITWDKVRFAKEEILRLINASSAALPDPAEPQELSRQLLELYVASEKSPVREAIEALREEILVFTRPEK